MSENVIFALLWLVFSTGLIASFAVFLGWWDDRHEGRNARRAVE